MAEHADRAARPAATGRAAPAPAGSLRHQGLEQRGPGAEHRRVLDGRKRTQSAPPDRSGIPAQLKAGAEALSGISLDDVRVHYNSSRPAGMDALAFTQGSDIHVAPGQERHLAHEVWHAVQQKQGRVKPTAQMKNVPLNADASLEREADSIGARLPFAAPSTASKGRRIAGGAGIVQAKGPKKLSPKAEQNRQNLLDKQARKYAEKQAREKAYWDAWKADIRTKQQDVLQSREVKRYFQGDLAAKGRWDSAVAALLVNLNNLHASNSASTRNALRGGLENAWGSKAVHPGNFPSKIWNVIQEVFDARTIYLSGEAVLLPGGGGHPDLDAATPDYFQGKRDASGKVAKGTPVGDAINLTAVDTPGAIQQAVKDTRKKVGAYPGAKVTVVIGAHHNPDLLKMENLAKVREGVADLAVKPASVIIVSGGLSSRAYP
jgi:hypothetical protein